MKLFEIYTLFAIFSIVALSVAFLLDLEAEQNEDKKHLFKQVDKLYWQNHDLKLDLAYCNYHLGNTQSIVLSSTVIPMRIR